MMTYYNGSVIPIFDKVTVFGAGTRNRMYNNDIIYANDSLRIYIILIL